MLAIKGGTAVRTKAMPFRQAFGPAEIELLQETINYYASKNEDPPYQGHFEKQFCDNFINYMGESGFADAVSTGTASVYVALAALNLPKGSEVIISPVTDSGPLNCIIMQGYIPVLADSAPNSYNIGVTQMLERVTAKTSAVLAVHAAGEPLEIDLLVEAAHHKNIKVLEDCSQAPGALCNGRKVGTFGDIAAFSTMYRKNLTTGGSGGLIYTKDQNIFHQALAHADRGKQVWRKDLNLSDPTESLFPALNFNTNEFSSAIGIASLKRLDQTIKQRNAFLQKFVTALTSESSVCKPYNFHSGFSPFYFPVFVDTKQISCSKIDFAKAVAAEGIGLLPHYGCLIAGWKFAKPYLSDNFATPNAFKTRDTSFNLFLNEQYGEEEVKDCIKAIKKVEEHYQI